MPTDALPYTVEQCALFDNGASGRGGTKVSNLSQHSFKFYNFLGSCAWLWQSGGKVIGEPTQ